MAVIKINTSAVSSLGNDIRYIWHRNEEIYSKLRIVENSLEWKIQSRSSISARINKLQRRIDVQGDKFEALRRALERTVDDFNAKDKNLSKEARELVYLMRTVATRKPFTHRIINPSIKTIEKLNALEILNLLFGITSPHMITLGIIQAASSFIVNQGDGVSGERSGFAKFINNDLKIDGSLLHGEKGGSTDFLGFDTSGNVAGDLLYGKAGIKTSSSFKLKDEEGNWNFDKFGFSTKASATGAIARGEAEGNIGYLHGKVEGEVGSASAAADVRATLWDDGEFNPSLSIGAEAEVSAAKGEVEAGFGTDDFGLGVGAEGDVLHAEAEARAGIGYIGTNDDGEAVYGVSAEASAMASAAQGKVEGGVTIFGIDIDLGVKGYAGAAGVEAGGSMSFDGVKASIGGALAIGAGVEISIDWSDAEWIGDTVDAVGDFVDGAADVAEDVGNFFVSGFKQVQGWF